MELRFTSVHIKVHIHGTEDAEKTLGVVSKVLKIPLDLFSHTKTEGHFGNPILIYSANLAKDSAEAFVANMLSELYPLDKSTLREEIWKHIDDRGDLHLRLGKQNMFSGRITLGALDVVWIKIKSHSTGSREELVSAYRSLF